VAFSTDGKRLASGSSDLKVKIWDAATRKEVLSFKEHDGVVRSVAFSPDGKRLASTGQGGTVRVWDTATGREQRALNGHPERAWAVAFSPNGKRLASAGGILVETPGFKTPIWDGGEVKVWDMETGKEVLSLKQKFVGEFYSVSFSPDGNQLATGSSLGQVTIWDTTTGKQAITRSFGGTTKPVVYGVAFSPNGKRLAVARGRADKPADPADVEIWDASTGEKVLILRGHTATVTGVAFAPDGMRLASAGFDGTVRVWDVADREHRFLLPREEDLLNSSPESRRKRKEYRPVRTEIIYIKGLQFEVVPGSAAHQRLKKLQEESAQAKHRASEEAGYPEAGKKEAHTQHWRAFLYILCLISGVFYMACLIVRRVIVLCRR
jgi:WD40 repeat protein